ncbi:MAG TPA: hypothetical protein VE199_00050 [Nitrososphaera sp.]|nr:hypothetical protein [Nitrososphaera sp.]
MPSVTEILQRLKESGHIIYEKYGAISLLESGMSVEKIIHDVLWWFFSRVSEDDRNR